MPVSFESLSIHGNTDVSNNWLLIFELLGKCPVTHDESDRMFWPCTSGVCLKESELDIRHIDRLSVHIFWVNKEEHQILR